MSNTYEIFISFKKKIDGELTEDYQIAKKLYTLLTDKGYHVFFSEEEINKTDSSNFSLIIDEALNQSKLLIYVCTNLSFLESPYVKYEWSSFSNEIKSGHKKGHILGLVKGIEYPLLPYTLRSHEIFNSDDDYLKLLTHVSHLVNEHSTNVFNIDDLIYRDMLLNKFSFRDVHTFERDELNHFFEFSIENKTKLSIISYEKYVDASTLIYKLSKEYHESHFKIYYVGDIDVFDFMPLKAFKPTEPMYVIIDKIYLLEHSVIITDLLKLGYIVICAIPCELTDIIQSVQSIDDSSTFQLEVLTEEETSRYVRNVAKEIGLPLSGNLETILVLPSLKELRTPFMIRFILTSINGVSGYSDKDYNIIDIFEIIENYLSRQNSRINEAVEYLFSIVLKKKINRFTHLETKNYQSEVDILYHQGIMKKTSIGFTITNQEYFLYRVALATLNEFGLAATLENFRMFEAAIPYYIYLIYLDTKILDDQLILNLSNDLKEKMISLFLSEEEALDQLLLNTNYRANVNGLLSRFRKSGLYYLARHIIQRCESLNIQSDNVLDYLSEKILIYYYENGQLLDVSTKLFKSIYHVGYVYYCLDEPFKALENYKIAYELMIESNQYNTSFMFDYIDTLLDLGDKKQIKQLIDESLVYCDNKSDEFIIRYNLIMGMLSLDDLAFGLAEEYYKIALYTALKIFNLKRIQISYGELGRLYIYQARYDEGFDYLQRNLEIAKSISDFNGMAIASKLIALIYLLKKNFLDAYRYFSYAESYAEQINNYWRLYKIRLYLDLIDNQRQLKYDRDINNLKSMKSEVFYASAMPIAALLLLKQQKNDKALSMLEEAIKYGEKIQNQRYIEISRMIMNAIYNHEYQSVNKVLIYQHQIIDLISMLKSNQKIDLYLPLPNFQFRTLIGSRIELRQMDVKYADDIFEYTSNRASTRYVLWERHKDIKDTLSFIENVYDVESAGYSLTWAIYHVDDKKVIGTIDLNYREEYKNVEVGYILNNKYWHMGYATEALQLVIDFARNYLPIKQLYGVVMPENKASVKVLEKNGFKYEKKIENYHTLNDYSDKSGDIYIYSLL